MVDIGIVLVRMRRKENAIVQTADLLRDWAVAITIFLSMREKSEHSSIAIPCTAADLLHDRTVVTFIRIPTSVIASMAVSHPRRKQTKNSATIDHSADFFGDWAFIIRSIISFVVTGI